MHQVEFLIGCGIIWLTTNGAVIWFAIDTPFVAPEPIYSLHLTDSINVLGVGGDLSWRGLELELSQFRCWWDMETLNILVQAV